MTAVESPNSIELSVSGMTCGACAARILSFRVEEIRLGILVDTQRDHI